ncbi:MAG: transporter [Ilumatobacteraceae bacterium]|nr:transporter [Ilumatobacteraceae bacterium]
MEGAGAVLRKPLGWGGVLLAGLLGTIMTFSYLGGFLDPVRHLAGLKVGIVDADAPVDVAGNHIDGGDQVVRGLLDSGRREIEWVRYPTRAAAMEAIRDDQIIGAVVVRPGFSQALGDIGIAGGRADPARIDMLSNDGAGLFQSQVFGRVTNELEREVNASANDQLVAVLADVGVKIDPAGAARVGRPVELRTIDVVSVDGRTARGLAPFYAAVMATLTGFLAASVTSLMVDVLRGTEHLELLGKQVHIDTLDERPVSTWIAKATLAVAGACLGGFAVAFVSVVVLEMPSVGFWPTAGLAALGAVAIALVTLIFLTLFGIGGELLGVLFTTIFGVPAALGVYPVEALPPFFRFLSGWHPMHYLTDGMRSLIFYDGRAAAGMERAVQVLVFWIVGAAIVGYLSARLIQRRGGQVGTGIKDKTHRHLRHGRPGKVPVHLEAAHLDPAAAGAGSVDGATRTADTDTDGADGSGR